MMVRRSVALELGGFDETFFLDFEDLDLGWRAWLAGYKSVHVPAAEVRHRLGAATGPDLQRRRLVSSHHNLLRFGLKCLPAPDALRVVATELMRIGIHPALVPPALISVARELPEIVRLRSRISPTRRFLEWAVRDMPSEGFEPARRSGLADHPRR
jgi:GT2 family glycosyltransferase